MTTAPKAKAKITCSPTEPTIEVERWFAAPAAAVYAAATKPELLKRWWGPCNSTLETCEIDLRVGGKWRFQLRWPDGRTDGFSGEFRAIEPARRVVQTWVYDPFPQAPALETSTYTEDNGRTKLTILIRHQTMEARDGHVGAGMEHGMAETHARLDELLAETARAA